MKKLQVEVNPDFRDDSIRLKREGGGGILFTPPLSPEYYLARVRLYRDQAIVVFPKFGLLGCGFAREEDWNTNLPLAEPAKIIFEHIKHNKLYQQIEDADCVRAIRMLQEWAKETGIRVSMSLGKKRSA